MSHSQAAHYWVALRKVDMHLVQCWVTHFDTICGFKSKKMINFVCANKQFVKMKLLYFEEGLRSFLTHTLAPHQPPHQATALREADVLLVQWKVYTTCENETGLLWGVSPALVGGENGWYFGREFCRSVLIWVVVVIVHQTSCYDKNPMTMHLLRTRFFRQDLLQHHYITIIT